MAFDFTPLTIRDLLWYILAMKKNIIISLAFVFVGLFFTGISILAEKIGLDKNPGNWSRTRILVLAIGVILVLVPIVYLRFESAFRDIARAFSQRVLENRVAASVWQWPSVQYASRLFKNYSFTLPILFIIFVLYIWLVSSGTWTEWVSPSRFYASLAQGFEYKTLSVAMTPDPRLAELENPYDPKNWRGTIEVPMDISYYKGRFYLYWGAAPAFILFVLHPFYNGRIGDLQLTFVFICGIFFFQYLFVIALWDRFFSGLPKWMLQISLLLTGLVCPLTFMLAPFKGARIYEAAISSGQFFLLAGFLVAVTALNKQMVSACLRFFLAGVLWAFSFGSRMTLIFPVALLSLMVAYWFYKEKQSLLPSVIKLFFLGLPLGIGAACIGWYNWARFGSVTEAGLYYQLTAGLYLQKYNKELIDPIYTLQNLYNYLVYPFDVSPHFPFFSPRYTYATPIFSFYPLPELYAGQWVTGLLWTVPFILFSCVPLARLWTSFRASTPVQSEQRKLNWIILAMTTGFLGAFVFLLVFFWAAMRYQADFMPFLLMLSIVGFWQGYQLLSENAIRRRIYVVIGVALASISIINSTLLALAVNDARFLLIKIFQ